MLSDIRDNLQTPDCVSHFHDWVSDMSAFVKSLAPQQLLTVGSEVAFAAHQRCNHVCMLIQCQYLHLLRRPSLHMSTGVLRGGLPEGRCQPWGLGNWQRAGFPQESRFEGY